MKQFIDEYLKFKREWDNRDASFKDISDETCLYAFEIYMKSKMEGKNDILPCPKGQGI